MPRYVNRRAANYHQFALRAKSDSDLVASILLALNYSGRRSATRISQSLIQKDCVAVCSVYDPLALGKLSLWISSNSQRMTDGDLEELRIELPNNDIDMFIVKNGTPNVMHAEMQLLSELMQVGISVKTA